MLEVGTLGLFGKGQNLSAHATRVVAENNPDSLAIATKRAPGADHYGSLASALQYVKSDVTLSVSTSLLVAVNLTGLGDNDVALLARFIVDQFSCCCVRFFLWAQLHSEGRVEKVTALFSASGLTCRQFALKPSTWSPFSEHLAVWTNLVVDIFSGDSGFVWASLNLYEPVLRLRLPAASDCIVAPWRLDGDDLEYWARSSAFGFSYPPGAAGPPCISSLSSGGVAPRFLWPSEAERMLGWEADLSACIPKVEGQTLQDRRKRRLQCLLSAPSSQVLAFAALALCPGPRG